jgi:hypothetical protein
MCNENRVPHAKHGNQPAQARNAKTYVQQLAKAGLPACERCPIANDIVACLDQLSTTPFPNPTSHSSLTCD